MGVAIAEGRRIRVRGTVQGVGFRPWVYRVAQLAGVAGRVSNDTSGVVIEAFGDSAALTAFIDGLHVSPPPAAAIADIAITEIEPEPATAFVIVESRLSDQRRVSIPPDLATCDDCVAEIFDPSNRRYRYPFTNCTNCGPRFTIARDIPYDRATTTMASFVMCPECRREYEDVGDRRFHAQPNACPACGPRVTLHTSAGELIAVDDPIASAAEALDCGLIVGLKGIGGFHLACNATYRDVVARLRERKHRDEKPFAVMVRDLAAAGSIAVLGPDERRLLTSIERPVVLVPKREGCALAANVAPHNEMVGLFLPYSPLHHLLLADAGDPLVMTSGNLSEEPIAFRNDEAIARLGSFADVFLLHDRDIQTRADDSVATVIDHQPVVLRRSRGYVPRGVRTKAAFARPVLACGALLKNTFCLAADDNAWLGPHIGDLENVATYDSYVEAISRLERFLQVRPEAIAHDLHPDYLSSRYAKQRPESLKVAVQHHHAHVASVMAEHHIDGPVIGIAYDGTGYGTDGTMWGGELLVADFAGFTRVATFRPIALPGGDRAIREPWRIGLALLLDAFNGDLPAEAWGLLDAVPSSDRSAVGHLLTSRLHTPLAHGVGRYFDGFGALFLGRTRASYEGQTALEWNQAADRSASKMYAFEIDHTSEPWQLDLRLMVREAVADFVRGEKVGRIAAAFHNTLAEATALVVRRIAAVHGELPVVASGGCFQNARLAESVRAALAPEFDVRLHQQVPPGDGGLALGQAVIADAMLRG